MILKSAFMTGQRVRVVAICLLLLAATLAAYEGARRLPILSYDDVDYLQHPHVQNGMTWRGVAWALGGIHFSNWHPLTTLSYMLDRQLWGEWAAPYHVENVLIHTAAGLALFGLLHSMTGAMGRSAFVAGLFLLHPLHVESVAWIAERKDVLCALFWFLTTSAYVAYTRAPSRRRYVGVLALYACALMSKSMAVTLPFTLLLLDIWPLGRVRALRAGATTPARAAAAEALAADRRAMMRPTARRLWLEKVPLLLMSAIVAFVTAYAQHVTGATRTLEHVPMTFRVQNAVVSYARYLGKTFWPRDLAVIYPFDERLARSEVLLAALLIVAISGVAIHQLRRRPYLFTGWFWYLGTLVPVIGLVQVGSAAMADRYTYIPLVGLSVALTWVLAGMSRGLRERRGVERAGVERTGVVLPGVAAAVVLVACGVRTWFQVQYWRDSAGLFRRAVEIEPRNVIAQGNLGTMYLRLRRYDLALAPAKAAAELEPDHAPYHYRLGLCYLGLGDHPSAIRSLRRALELDPNDGLSHLSLGPALMSAGEREAGERHVVEAARLLPDSPEAMRNLGMLRLGQKRYDEAIAALSRAVALDPKRAAAHSGLGSAFARRGGRDEEAIRALHEAIALDPNDAEAHLTLGNLLEKQRRIPQAIDHYRRAVALDARSLAANNLAWLLATAKDDSLRDGRQAVIIAEALRADRHGDRPEVLDTLAAAYAEAGDFDRAIATAREAADRAAVAGNATLAKEIRARLAMYEAKQPYREAK
jgi:tetratricopeptide (TPR) repeat protein